MTKKNQRIFGEEVNMDGVRSPFELYRRMRPYYFSDSKEVLKMTKVQFETVMSNLSVNMKQDQFEDFTQKLVIKLITPNIIPGTGPNGHGDGKTDLETHSVSDEISKYYIVKNGGCSGNEKWAFAISCTENWEAKMARDIKKIVETNRGFTKIFFCTSRKVPSRKRAEAYDKYKSEYNIEITILDYNWYEQAVFENGCYNTAIEALNLDHTLESTFEEGPNDRIRKEMLQQLDEKHASMGAIDKINTEYVNELLDAALLQRQISNGSPQSKVQIKMRFALALAEAQKHGLPQQEYDIHYQMGWTEFYWNEDPESMMKEYNILKDLLVKEVNPTRLEKANNLRNLVRTSINCNLFRTNQDLTEDEVFWGNIYKQLETDSDHKSSFLYLKIVEIESKLFNAIQQKEEFDSLIKELGVAMEEANHHLDISFETHFTIINEVGELIAYNPLYEQLIDQLGEILLKRKHDIDAADLHYSRGVQNMDKGNFESAIQHLGQCIPAYQKEQTRTNLVCACGMLAYAYSHLDLMYSAKVFYVKTISLLMHQMNVEGIASHLLITVMYELCVLDIRIGQLNDFLFWLTQMDQIVQVFPQYNDETYFQERMQLDAMWASVFLNTKPDLAELDKMPDVLGRLGLSVSQDTLLYRLGYEEKVSVDFRNIIMSAENWEKDLQEKVADIPVLQPTYIASKNQTVISTKVKGCQLTISFYSNDWQLCFAEKCLALIESFLATATRKEFAFATPNVLINLKVQNKGKTEIKKGNRSIEYTMKVNMQSSDERQHWELCLNLLGHILANNAMSRNITEYFTQKESDEKIGLRISILENYHNDFKNAIMRDYPTSIEKWFSPEDSTYPNRNVTPSTPISKYTGSQNDTIITNLIDYPLWDKAKWSGCGYIIDRMFVDPAIMLFMYKNIQYGKEIFEQWENDYLTKKLNLKIIIITGVDSDHPAWYKVLVTPDITKVLSEEDKKQHRYVMATSRFHLMQAKDDLNILYLKQAYSYTKVIGISAIAIEDNNQMSQDPNKRYSKIIPVRDVEFREAWTIGDNDIASAAILATDKPIIPAEHVSDAPVIQLINRKKYGKDTD